MQSLSKINHSRPTQELNTPKYISKNQIYSAIEKQRQMHRLSKSLHLPFILTLLPICTLTSASYDAISVVIVNFTIFYPPSFPSIFGHLVRLRCQPCVLTSAIYFALPVVTAKFSALRPRSLPPIMPRFSFYLLYAFYSCTPGILGSASIDFCKSASDGI